MVASSIRTGIGVFALSFAVAAATASAQTRLKWTTEDGSTSVALGGLAQTLVQFDTSLGQSTTDIYFRRLRVVASGSVQRKLTFFIDSDTPFLGRRNGIWTAPPTIVQDAFVTYAWRAGFQVDAGLMLVPNSYNSTQSASSLTAIGYGPYSFLASAPTYSRTGRDQGIQLRGYLASTHIEYRAGVFRGLSRVNPNAARRYAARVAWYPFGAQTGFFYAGAFPTRKKMLSVGVSVDGENSYHSIGADIFAELPVAGGTITFQSDLIRYDGGVTFAQLPRQNAWLFEAGYRMPGGRAAAFAQWARQDLRRVGSPDASTTQVGVTFWLRPSVLNIKLGVGRTTKDGSANHRQLMVQGQYLLF